MLLAVPSFLDDQAVRIGRPDHVSAGPDHRPGCFPGPDSARGLDPEIRAGLTHGLDGLNRSPFGNHPGRGFGVIASGQLDGPAGIGNVSQRHLTGLEDHFYRHRAAGANRRELVLQGSPAAASDQRAVSDQIDLAGSGLECTFNLGQLARRAVSTMGKRDHRGRPGPELDYSAQAVRKDADIAAAGLPGQLGKGAHLGQRSRRAKQGGVDAGENVCCGFDPKPAAGSKYRTGAGPGTVAPELSVLDSQIAVIVTHRKGCCFQTPVIDRANHAAFGWLLKNFFYGLTHHQRLARFRPRPRSFFFSRRRPGRSLCPALRLKKNRWIFSGMPALATYLDSMSKAPAANTPSRRPATPDELRDAKERLEKALAKGGADALTDIRPVAISATLDPRFQVGDPETMLERSVEITPIVNPLFESVLLALGFDRLGERSFAIGAGKKLPSKIIMAMLKATPSSMLVPSESARNADKRGLNPQQGPGVSHYLYREMCQSASVSRIPYSDFSKALGKGQTSSGRGWHRPATEDFYGLHSMVSCAATPSQIILTVCSVTSAHRPKDGLTFWPGSPDLNLMRQGGRRDPVKVTPAEAVALLENAKAWGFPVHDGGGISGLRKAVKDSVLIERVPGSPGLARVVAYADSTRNAVRGSESLGEEFGMAALGESPVFAVQTASGEAQKIARKMVADSACLGSHVVADPQVADVVKMFRAKPTGGRDPLRPYQDEAVSLHLSTNYGYVNACAPGLGKTLMALFAQREKAGKVKGYRSLVVCPAAIRSQWMGEARKFFPEARVETFTARAAAKKLDGFLADAGDDPAIVFLSYDAMRGAAEKLAENRWHDLICDEAAILGSTGTARTKALWDLREVSDVAVALTGTPINRSLDDLGYIVAWTRGDETAFYGQKLSKRFDMASDADVSALWDALGPTVFRRDRSEIADQLPHIDTEVLTLDPEPAELRLANGARDELRRIYDTLQKKLEVAEELRPDDPKLRQAREDMKKIRGAVLGGVTLARMAACDPNSLRDSKSKSAGVALLEAAKLIDPAIKNGGTKRNLITGLTEELVGRGDAVLIFTDFSTVAEGLAADLRKAGVKVGTFTGKNSGKKRDQAALDFQSGDLDCLVLTGAGREGLNLQRASVLIHYDLPWVPSQVVQRVGRASRFGSTSDKLSVLIPIMAGTIEEKVASLLVPRAVEALRALDSHRGVKGSETEMGLAVGGLEDAVSDEMKAEKSGLFDLAAEVLA